AWFPRFQGEMNGISSTVAAFLRNQYSVGFSPSSPPDGRYHKLTVQVVDDDGNPMELVNKKGKKKKVVVIAREGYTAPSAAAVD
ncbi:MAG: VWA domain-containing protein, partial [Acidobacteriia bacterium]|nr:VWA domain-containing protein [Terriglobia bacterium]